MVCGLVSKIFSFYLRYSVWWDLFEDKVEKIVYLGGPMLQIGRRTINEYKIEHSRSGCGGSALVRGLITHGAENPSGALENRDKEPPKCAVPRLMRVWAAKSDQRCAWYRLWRVGSRSVHECAAARLYVGGKKL